MEQEPLQFEKEVLPNGITCFWNTYAGPVVHMDLILPVGAAHTKAGTNLPPGSVHFLEHCMFLQSKHHPEPHQFEIELNLQGCDRDGTTYPLVTSYGMNCPLEALSFASRSLYETVYEPIFTEEHLAIERDVIRNERDQEARYFPGRSRQHQYVNREFRKTYWRTLEQVFGSDADLDSFTPESIKIIHDLVTSTPGAIFLGVGNSDFQEIRTLLRQVKTREIPHANHEVPFSWADPAFRYVSLEGVAHPVFVNSWIKPLPSFEAEIGISFILNFAINHVHGVLYDEYRRNRGWTYGLSKFVDTDSKSIMYGFDIALQDKEQIEEVRKSFHSVLRAGLENQEKVAKEITRRFAFEAFQYQKAGDIMRSAYYDVLSYGPHLKSQAEWKAAVKKMADPTWRMHIFDTYFNDESYGEIAFIPEE